MEILKRFDSDRHHTLGSRSLKDQLLIDEQAPNLATRGETKQALNRPNGSKFTKTVPISHNSDLLKAVDDTRRYSQSPSNGYFGPTKLEEEIMHPDRAKILRMGFSQESAARGLTDDTHQNVSGAPANKKSMDGGRNEALGTRFCTTGISPNLALGPIPYSRALKQRHLVVCQPMTFLDTAPSSKPGTYGSAGRTIPGPDRMAPPTVERREEVTRNFNGCSANYPVVLD